MKTYLNRRRWLAASALSLAAACAAALAVVSQEQRPERLPREYRSEVKGLAIESVTVDRDVAEGPALVVVIRNKTNRAVTSYTVTVGEYHQGMDGGLKTDVPVPVIEPRGTERVEIPLDNIKSDGPLVITEAFYDDGTEEGRERMRQWRREARARAKEKRDAGKGGPQ
jgi:hypothetical protein